MRDITLCHPRLQFLAGRLEEECRTRGLSIKIGETYRTVLEQENLYAQGRTKPGDIVTNARGITYDSFHQWGTAFDFYRNDGRGAYNEEGQFFEKVGAMGEINPIFNCRTGAVVRRRLKNSTRPRTSSKRPGPAKRLAG